MKCPTSVIVLGIINLIWGALGVCGLAWNLILRFGLVELPGEDNQLLELMQGNIAFQLYTDISTAIGAVATILIISASIGMFILQSWARLATIGWGIYTIVMTVFGTILSYVLIFKPALDAATDPQRFGLKIGMFFGFGIGILTLAYCLVMIAILCRSSVKAAFRGDKDLLLPDEDAGPLAHSETIGES